MGVLLSIVLPGMGQVYSGKVLRGIISFFIVVAPAAALIWYYLLPDVRIGELWYVPFVGVLVLDAAVIADAYIQAAGYNVSHRCTGSISIGISVLLLAGILSALSAVNVFYIGMSLARNGFIKPYVCPPDSMAPSIYQGERVLVDMLAYRRKEPARGDIVLYVSPVYGGRINMHRIVGLPGETIELKDHKILINGVSVKESWCARTRYYNRGKFGQKKQQVVVPKDSYYVVGDASANSNDSRFWGFVPKSNLLGKVFKIYYPYKRSGPVSSCAG